MVTDIELVMMIQFKQVDAAKIAPGLSFEWLHEHLVSEKQHRACIPENYYAGAPVVSDHDGVLGHKTSSGLITMHELVADWTRHVFKTMSDRSIDRWSVAPGKLVVIVPHEDDGNSTPMFPKLFGAISAVVGSLQPPVPPTHIAFVHESSAIAAFIFRKEKAVTAAVEEALLHLSVGASLQVPPRHTIVLDVQRSRFILMHMIFKDGAIQTRRKETYRAGRVDFEIATARLRELQTNHLKFVTY
jgi:hypothetical protein